MFSHIDHDYITDLCLIMQEYGSDKGGPKSKHNYTTVYSALFEPIKHDVRRVFEMGIGTQNPDVPSNMVGMGETYSPGASMRGWRHYFPKAQVFGADVDGGALFEEDRIKTFQCDQTNGQSVVNLWAKPELIRDFDVIIDDGLHEFSAGMHLMRNSLHKVLPMGYYIIEDIPGADMSLFDRALPQLRKEFPNFEFWLLPLSEDPHSDNNLLVVRHCARDSIPNKLRGHHPFHAAMRQNWHHVLAIENIMREHKADWHGVGTYMSNGTSAAYCTDYIGKQELLFEEATEAKSCLQLGVHAAQAVLIMLLANPSMHVTLISEKNWTHTGKCVEYLSKAFPDCKLQTHEGALTDMDTKGFVATFDLIHLNSAHHDTSHSEKDIDAALRLVPHRMVINDYSDGPYEALRNIALEPYRVSSGLVNSCSVRLEQKSIMVTAYFEISAPSTTREESVAATDHYSSVGNILLKASPRTRFILFTNVPSRFEGHSNVQVVESTLEQISGVKVDSAALSLPVGLPPENKWDTAEYMMVQHSKMNMCCKALEMCPEFTHATWIDVGHMRHFAPVETVCAHPETDARRIYTPFLARIAATTPERLRIVGRNEHEPPNTDIHVNVIFYFAGSLFGGPASDLYMMRDLCAEKFRKMVLEESRITWEVNVWMQTVQEHPELFPGIFVKSDQWAAHLLYAYLHIK